MPQARGGQREGKLSSAGTFDRTNAMLMSAGGQPATLVYGPSDYRVVRPGKFVLCAVSGEPIELRDLTYWSSELQEAYATAEIATRRIMEAT